MTQVQPWQDEGLRSAHGRPCYSIIDMCFRPVAVAIIANQSCDCTDLFQRTLDSRHA